MQRGSEFTRQIDREVGLRVRELRVANGLTRQQLADELDVSMQQLEKYESGKNRMSPGRLYAIAIELKHPISYFFNEPISEYVSEGKKVAIEVSRNFMKIKNPMNQHAVNVLVKTLAENK